MADPVGDAIRAAGVTPNRTVTLTFDHSETVNTEPYLFVSRQAHEMQPATLTNVIKLKSGVYIMKPVNDIDVSSENATAQSYVLRLSAWTRSSYVTEIPRQRTYTELTGIGAGTQIASSGDYYLQKRVPAGSTYSSSISALPSVTALTDTNYPLDRIAYTTDYHQEQTGYLLRMTLPGAYLRTADYVLGLQFGGPLIADSTKAHQDFGLFYLLLSGDGQALLYERVDGVWVEVSRWRYNTPRDMADAKLMMRIIPHAPKQIEFTSMSHGDHPDLLGQLGEAAFLAVKAAQKQTQNFSSYTHICNNRGELAYDGGNLRSVTGSGQVFLDVRRDLNCLVQLSRLAYPASASLIDRPVVLPYGVGGDHVVQAWKFGYGWSYADPTLATFDVELQEADGSPLAATTETVTWRGTNYTVPGWSPPGGQNLLRARITFTNTEPANNKWHTPVFLHYTVIRENDRASFSPTATVTQALNTFDISGQSYDPEHESANVTIQDVTNSLAFLRSRGGASMRLETTFDPLDQTKKVILFEGYLGRATATHRGRAGATYPSADWHLLSVDAMGKWFRLDGQFYWQRMHFGERAPLPHVPTTAGSDPRWKITDIIRKTLATQGFDETQLDIFDDEIRVLVSPNAQENLFDVAPGTLIAPLLKSVARDYLNAFLYWDPNAGQAGMWRLLRPPTGTETPVWSFVTTAAASPKLQYRGAGYGGGSGPYGAATSPILGDLRSYVVPPEGNAITVFGGEVRGTNQTARQVHRQLINPASWDSPTHATADTSSIDFIGYVKPIEYIDTTITSDDPELAQRAVDFIARRIYNLACRGQKWFEFTAELVLVDGSATEPSIYSTRTHRLLHPGDTIMVDGNRCVVHSIQPYAKKAHIQLMRIEAQYFRTENTFA